MAWEIGIACIGGIPIEIPFPLYNLNIGLLMFFPIDFSFLCSFLGTAENISKYLRRKV